MYIQIGKKYVQPRIVFHGEKGRRVLEQIMNDKCETTDYMKTYSERLKLMEKKVREARSMPDYK